jgi:hypothetical protein
MNHDETLALFAQGKEAWNEWAERMLAERKALEEKGEWLDAARADFTSHSFTEEADFSGLVFPGEARFGNATFSENASFDKATFSVRAIFKQATFSGGAYFNQATFTGYAVFSEAKFALEARFSNATFSGCAEFDNAKFAGNAVFDNAQFAGGAGFDNATFSENARFDNATFSKNARFEHATFSGSASFDEATFAGNTLFREAKFSEDARFNLARFEGYTTFEDTSFEKAASFIAIKGESFFSLRGVIFGETPDFEQAHFSEAPRLDTSRYPDKAEPGATARWRALKRLAVQGHDHEREQLFFAQEIKSLRGITDWPWPRLQKLFSKGEPVWRNGARYWFGLAYQIFSDFGRSMVRPVLWWAALTAGFALFYLDQHFPYKTQPDAPGLMCWRDWRTCHDRTQPYAPGLMSWNASGREPPLACVATATGGAPLVSAIFLAVHKGSVAGLGGSEKLAQTYACLYGEDAASSSKQPLVPDIVAFAGFFQALLSAPLIFLFLLAVRNHFRIK